MKKLGIVTLVVGLLALAATLGRTVWAETVQGKAAAITQLSGAAAVTDVNKTDAVPSPAGAVAAAGELAVNITSFNMIESSTRLAEICGKVTGSDAEFTVVRILVDPKSSTPGAYNTLAAKDGAFCSVVVTYTRTASASVRILGKDTTSRVASASETNIR
ncbi:MAG: hypothetical protein NTY45_10650 [Elusimicrobia bacterium]|nr:hypothetical protein [Elusimicrobiota bacterium]